MNKMNYIKFNKTITLIFKNKLSLITSTKECSTNNINKRKFYSSDMKFLLLLQ
jgi:hypothetical protein